MIRRLLSAPFTYLFYFWAKVICLAVFTRSRKVWLPTTRSGK